MAIWIRVPWLPMELYNADFLNHIGNAFGSMLKIDRLTSLHSREKFTGIYVEINLGKPFVPFIMIYVYKFNLEYKGHHAICFNYEKYYHKSNECSKKIERSATTATPKEAVVVVTLEETTLLSAKTKKETTQ